MLHRNGIADAHLSAAARTANWRYTVSDIFELQAAADAMFGTGGKR
ncbi:hypothetical protein [Delftia sp. PS-11]|nr:hypothetical protein [Delftia sp. PS-11]